MRYHFMSWVPVPVKLINVNLFVVSVESEVKLKARILEMATKRRKSCLKKDLGVEEQSSLEEKLSLEGNVIIWVADFNSLN